MPTNISVVLIEHDSFYRVSLGLILSVVALALYETGFVIVVSLSSGDGLIAVQSLRCGLLLDLAWSVCLGYNHVKVKKEAHTRLPSVGFRS